MTATVAPISSNPLLTQQCAALDNQAWTALEHCYGDGIHAHIRQALARAGKAGDHALADECYTAVLERLFRNDCHVLRCYDTTQPLEPFLATVAWHVTQDQLRALRRREKRQTPLGPAEPAATCPAFPCLTIEELDGFIANLSPRLRELCRYVMDAATRPAPAWLKPTNQRQWLHRLRQAFRAFLYETCPGQVGPLEAVSVA